ASICYGQIYVGVHYPLDVIGGALLGTFIGWLMSQFYKSKIGIIQYDLQ
ncbi:MAG: phosphatase PAP2 family protein, partial [Sphingobacteriia bacterium]